MAPPRPVCAACGGARLLWAIAPHCLTPAATSAVKQGDDSSGPQNSGPGSNSGGTEGETGTVETAPVTWTAYTDPETGYALAYPPSWTVRAQSASDTTTDFVDPETGTYLRVDWTDEPGPSSEGAWEQQSDSCAQSLDDHSDIRIDPATYQGLDAALRGVQL